MIKSPVFTIALLISFAATAQIPKGTIMAGADSNLGLASSLGTGNTSTALHIYPKVGYFFMDNWVGGLNLGFSTGGNKTYHYTTTSLGFYSRYYIKGKIFVGGEYGVFFSNNKSDTPVITNKYHDDYGSLSVGYAAFITPNIAIEPTLGYGLGLGRTDSPNISLGVGFMLFFNKAKKP